ncbi:proto-oncogene tyrosine-protein kinase ROS-like [Nylanderia fulva]|uniref:proto-oncogene tyrosine-protein kinase ROS-like n=1 Tax=Nylanderia fulva TaxID=613905 RepID=UPI0010FB0F09|nr:proto-oncogene tyrosine-protein kinase ROS-like [Nylanderia fulva]
MVLIYLKYFKENTTIFSKDGPREPTCSRAFVEFGDKLNRKEIFVTFRWNKPELTIGEIQKYRIQYFEDLNQTITIVDIFPLPNRTLQYKAYDLEPDTIYYFNVQAHNEFGAGPYTKFINVSTTHDNPVPLLLVTGLNTNDMTILDMDLQIGFEIDTSIKYEEIIYSALEDKIYGITGNGELIVSDFNRRAIQTNLKYTNITNIDGFPENLCIDWIYRNLYWAEYNEAQVYIKKLDLTLWQQMDKHDKISIPIPSKISAAYIKAHPYAGSVSKLIHPLSMRK